MQAFVKTLHPVQAVYSVLHYNINAHLQLLFVFSGLTLFLTSFSTDLYYCLTVFGEKKSKELSVLYLKIKQYILLP